MEGRWEGRRGKGERDERRREEGGRKGGNERGKRRGGGNGRVSREKGSCMGAPPSSTHIEEGLASFPGSWEPYGNETNTRTQRDAIVSFPGSSEREMYTRGEPGIFSHVIMT